MADSCEFLVIGAGINGLRIARELHVLGKRVLCIDREDHIGGMWYTNRYENTSCQLHSSKFRYDIFAWQSPIDRPSSAHVLLYLRDFVKTYNLSSIVLLNRDVRDIAVLDDNRLAVTVCDKRSGTMLALRCDHVIHTSHSTKPCRPVQLTCNPRVRTYHSSELML